MKKGFTIVELLASIVILGVITTIAIVGVSSFLTSSKKDAYLAHEATLKRGAEAYLLEHSAEIPSNTGGTLRINASTLLSEKYIDMLKDPSNKSDCTPNSYIIVTRNTDVGYNTNLDYKACLICAKYRSAGC